MTTLNWELQMILNKGDKNPNQEEELEAHLI